MKSHSRSTLVGSLFLSFFLPSALAACSSGSGDAGGTAADSATSTDSSAEVSDSRVEGDSAPPTDSTVAPDTNVDATADEGADADGAADTLVAEVTPHDGAAFACDSVTRASRWRSMVSAPVSLPNKAAKLDLAPGGAVITIDDAEKILCSSSDLGDQYGDGTQVGAWGDSNEVWMNYAPATGKAKMLSLWAGYLGTVTAKSADGAHTYTIPVNSQISKDGAAFTLESGWKSAAFTNAVDELSRALMATFAPTVAADPAGVTCVLSKKCVIGTFGDVGYVYFKPLGFSFWVDNRNAAEPVPSIPTRFDLFLITP